LFVPHDAEARGRQSGLSLPAKELLPAFDVGRRRSFALDEIRFNILLDGYGF
jgi:hypothetical protein